MGASLASMAFGFTYAFVFFAYRKARQGQVVTTPATSSEGSRALTSGRHCVTPVAKVCASEPAQSVWQDHRTCRTGTNTSAPVAIVTAASRGIGAATARELAGRGYRLALFARSDAVHDVARDTGAIAVQGSLTEPDDLARLVEQTHAGVRPDRRRGQQRRCQRRPGRCWRSATTTGATGFDLLLLSVIRMARLVTPHLAAGGGGAIVNVSTYAALDPDPAFPVSATVRAGLAAFTRLYAAEHGRAGIRMNSVLPGHLNNHPEQDQVRQRVPLRRYGSPEELAGVVAFLLGPDSGYLTGQNIRVDGGLAHFP